MMHASIPPDLPYIEWLKKASDQGLTATSIGLENMTAHIGGSFHPCRMSGAGFPLLGFYHDKKQGN